MKLKRKNGAFLIIIGTVLLLAALSLFAYNKWDDWRAGQAVVSIQEQLGDLQEEQTPDYNTGMSTEHGEEMEELEVEGYAYIGTIAIPDFGIQLPVMSQWSYAGLKLAPGRFSGSVWTNDLIICADNYERHFGNLKYLEAGDEVVFTDVNGNVFTYQVELVETLSPTAMEELESGAWDLTLFTCTLGGQARVTVRCSAVEEVR